VRRGRNSIGGDRIKRVRRKRNLTSPQFVGFGSNVVTMRKTSLQRNVQASEVVGPFGESETTERKMRTCPGNDCRIESRANSRLAWPLCGWGGKKSQQRPSCKESWEKKSQWRLWGTSPRVHDVARLSRIAAKVELTTVLSSEDLKSRGEDKHLCGKGIRRGRRGGVRKSRDCT